ncbi:hypothetical protein HAX54_009130 [Datura stramonium]|uniref:Uncharacterized protein n=1 Tax=Datura stramonium TaxID=4076 RepID=A0ABS8TEG9_DATST|nr:hypothetical protein [Datura stramonium]
MKNNQSTCHKHALARKPYNRKIWDPWGTREGELRTEPCDAEATLRSKVRDAGQYVCNEVRNMDEGESMLGFSLMTRRPVNVEVIMRGVLRRVRVKKGQRFSFWDLLIQFLRAQLIEEEDIDYRMRNILKRIDVMKTKDFKSQHGPVLSIIEHNA